MKGIVNNSECISLYNAKKTKENFLYYVTINICSRVYVTIQTIIKSDNV